VLYGFWKRGRRLFGELVWQEEESYPGLEKPLISQKYG